MIKYRPLCFLLLVVCAPAVFASNCTDVVDATVAETRAGATDWSSEDEQTVRSAAGAACVKATSQRYADDASQCAAVTHDTIAEMQAGAPAVWNERESGLARSAAGSACVKATSGRFTQAASKADDTRTAGVSEEKEKGSFSLGGLTIKPLTGPPSKKPYER